MDRKKVAALAMMQAGSCLFQLDRPFEEAIPVERKRRRSSATHVEQFYEVVVKSMSDSEFKKHFRLGRPTFELLTDKLENIYTEDTKIGRPSLSMPKQICITLWALANQESYR